MGEACCSRPLFCVSRGLRRRVALDWSQVAQVGAMGSCVPQCVAEQECTMLLSRLQCRRFFNMFDPLTTYANKRLDVVDEAELFAGGVRGIDEQAQAKVSRELWQNLGVIDDFVRENSSGLSAGELATVASWREGLTSMFIVDIFPDGELRFISSGYAFDVVGFSKEIEGMVKSLPAAVQCTLLPFDGRIVYAEYMIEYPIDFGEGMLDLFDEEIDRIYDEGNIVSGADELLAVAAEVRERELARDTSEMLADLESGRFNSDHDHDHGHHHDHECECGHHHDHDDYDDFDELDDELDQADYEQHRGVLAGLSYEERERAIDEHMAQDSLASRLTDILREGCVEGPVATGMAELLATEDEYDRRRLAKFMGLERARELTGQALIDDIVAHVADDGALQDIVNDLSEFRIKSLRELADRDGRWEVLAESIVSLRDLPIHEVGFSYVFDEGDSFVFVMPDEVLEVARGLDWEGALAKAASFRETVDFFDDIAELRGIVPVADAAAEFIERYPDRFESLEEAARELLHLMVQAVGEQAANFDLLQVPSGQTYLMHYELFWAYEEEMGLERDPYLIKPINAGELGQMLEGLLARQEGKDPRPLTDEMLAARNLFEWKIRQEPVQAFVRYLDAHVPAARDDYFFADKVIEELLADAMWGLIERGADPLFDILEDNDFIPEPDQIQTVLDLWTNMTNHLPVWPNNGWAPAELAQQELGVPLFFNADGSPQKVGRNDPCPCGSGLKYKKCCGK